MHNELDKTLRQILAENKLVYINKDGTGVGMLCMNNEVLYGKTSVSIEANTNDREKHFVKVDVGISMNGIEKLSPEEV